MLLGLISLLLGQWARWISKICVDSSLFNSRFYLCSEEDFVEHKRLLFEVPLSSPNETVIPPKGLFNPLSHHCGEGHEPFVSYEGLEQLHRFLFVLGITHVLYSCLAVGVAMIKIYNCRRWESQASAYALEAQAKKNKVMRRQTTFAFHHASRPWSRNHVLIWMLCFLRQFKSSIRKSDEKLVFGVATGKMLTDKQYAQMRRITTVDSRSKALKFLGFEEDEESTSNQPIISPNVQIEQERKQKQGSNSPRKKGEWGLRYVKQ